MTRAGFAARLGLPADSALLRAALTHRSAAKSRADSNERLEFLGDALLGAFVAERLVEGYPPDTEEGTLTRARVAVVRRETLAAAARALDLSELLEVGPGERKEERHRQDGLLADAYEAVVAALALERGTDAARVFVRETLAGPLAAALSGAPPADPKNRLQELLQREGQGLPLYRVVRDAPGAGVEVTVTDAAGNPLGHGVGPSKRAAERNAAEDALRHPARPGGASSNTHARHKENGTPRTNLAP